MQLRPYQTLAVAAVEDHFATFGTDLPPVVVLPTGAGKTPVIATLCRNWVREAKRVLVLAHVRELLQQAVDKLHAVDPSLHVGVCCAGLGRKQTRTPIVVASVQTACRYSERFGPFDRVIIDESHRVCSTDGTQYASLLNSQRQLNPSIQILGLTATPFRLDSGPICGPDQIFGAVCFEVGVRQLIYDGYLSPLVTRVGDASVDTSGIRVNAGEFVQREAQAAMGRDDRVRAACTEIVAASAGRRGILIFCTGVEHAEKVVTELRNRHAVECGLVTGAMASGARDRVIGRFRKGELRFMANVAVLTTGFDAPHVDLVALL
ncbi:MAG: DEAD/DEAH box helicase, partial [Phycisphaerae bacterium]